MSALAAVSQPVSSNQTNAEHSGERLGTWAISLHRVMQVDPENDAKNQSAITDEVRTHSAHPTADHIDSQEVERKADRTPKKDKGIKLSKTRSATPQPSRSVGQTASAR